MQKRIKEILAESIKLTHEISGSAAISATVAKIVKDIIKSIKNGGKIIVFGDGGSAADSQHLVCELIGRFKKDRPPIPAIALTTNTSTLTAIANDYDFSDTFVRQLSPLAKRGDIVIGISTSGNSPNVLKAIKEANKLKTSTVGLTGKGGGKLKSLCR